MTADLLETIVAAARRTVEARQLREPAAALERRALDADVAPRSFEAALSGDGLNIVAECKRRSPSRGVLRKRYEAAAVARAYASAGAAAISVLTEPTFFDGSVEDLAAVRRAVSLPLLRKDFIVSEYQLLEARAAGASAVLLIVAALGRGALERLLAASRALGLDALVEAHDDAELDAALEAGARIVGVNNRNLRTLDVDVHASERLIARIPREIVAVSESGLTSAQELIRLRSSGYRAFLIGERFMTAEDPGAALRDLIGASIDSSAMTDTKGTKGTKV
jgi:indole-3-glycerol phosphate synthase